jgi:hypothetical protein
MMRAGINVKVDLVQKFINLYHRYENLNLKITFFSNISPDPSSILAHHGRRTPKDIRKEFLHIPKSFLTDICSNRLY